MPNTPATTPNDSPARGILLVEEYRALGIALAAALQKFAPLHTVRVAHSFAEAETTAASTQPDLFVVDLDPPLSGDLAFFGRLRKHFPAARALVIATGLSREVRAARGTAGALQFIEKPFDLAEFGAAVQALLGRWSRPPAAAVRGRLRELHVLDAIELKCLTRAHSVVRVRNPEGEKGEIHFRHGQIAHARTGVLTGLRAFQEIVSWPQGELSEGRLAATSLKTIDRPWPELLLEALRRNEEAAHDSLGAEPVRESAAAKTGKKILVIDDTEMLLIFAADVLGTADPSFQIMTASTGSEGLRLAAEMRPDLVLLDYSLTDINGDEVCRRLLSDEKTARIPVLMMSGHVNEMAATARNFRNVVATLAKPFLSGALMNAVEKVLAAGPLPEKQPNPEPTQNASPPKPAEKLPNEKPAAEKNESRDGNPGGAAQGTDGSPPRAGTYSPEVGTAPEPIMVQPNMNRVASPVGKQTLLNVTLTLEVVSVHLSPLFKLEALALHMSDPSAALQTAGSADPQSPLSFETGFRLTPITLNSTGQIETVRLIPTQQVPRLIAADRAFAVGELGPQSNLPGQAVELIASPSAPMRVQLTAQFQLLMVELSHTFDVVAVLLKSSGTAVRLSNVAGGAGAAFAIEKTQLNSLGQLETLIVRRTA